MRDMTMTIAPLACDVEPRTFLFLQGHPSGFWPALGAALTGQGQRVLKVHFNLADQVYWGLGRGGVAFRGRFADWDDWLRDFVRTEGVTDILYYADRQPYHCVAAAVARDLGLRAWAVEFGYLRPDWLTLEPEGMGPNSRFPTTDDGVEALACTRALPDMRPLYGHGFAVEAAHEVGFGLLRFLGRPLFPRHRSDLYYGPLRDYIGWIRELAAQPTKTRAAHRLEQRIRETDLDFSLVAMQLQADYQVRACSPFAHLGAFLDRVLASFAQHAPPGRHLVIKLHPLDNGLENWPRHVARKAAALGIPSRVSVIKGGDLGLFLRRSRGVVLVNSTVGLHALRQGIPVCALGAAIYDRPGLTHQQGLDRFWTAPDPVDPEARDRFLRALTAIQVKGSFYHPEGRRVAISEIVARLTGAVSVPVQLTLPPRMPVPVVARAVTPAAVGGVAHARG